MNSNWSYSPETPNLGQNRRFFVPCDLEIWQMTLKNNRAPLLCYFKLCASFRSHLWIKTEVIVRKRPNWGKICFDFCELDLWRLILTFRMDIKSANGNNSWKFQDDTMRGTLSKRCEGWMDGQKEVFLELLGCSWKCHSFQGKKPIQLAAMKEYNSSSESICHEASITMMDAGNSVTRWQRITPACAAIVVCWHPRL